MTKALFHNCVCTQVGKHTQIETNMPVQAAGAPLKILCTVGRQTSLSSIISSELTKKPEVSSTWERGGNLEHETRIMKSKQHRSRCFQNTSQWLAQHLSAGACGQTEETKLLHPQAWFRLKRERAKGFGGPAVSLLIGSYWKAGISQRDWNRKTEKKEQREFLWLGTLNRKRCGLLRVYGVRQWETRALQGDPRSVAILHLFWSSFSKWQIWTNKKEQLKTTMLF